MSLKNKYAIVENGQGHDALPVFIFYRVVISPAAFLPAMRPNTMAFPTAVPVIYPWP